MFQPFSIQLFTYEVFFRGRGQQATIINFKRSKWLITSISMLKNIDKICNNNTYNLMYIP